MRRNRPRQVSPETKQVYVMLPHDLTDARVAKQYLDLWRSILAGYPAYKEPAAASVTSDPDPPSLPCADPPSPLAP